MMVDDVLVGSRWFCISCWHKRSNWI